VAWLEPRERLAAMIGKRFGLDGRAVAGLVAELRGGLVGQLVPDRAVTRALAAGWVPFVAMILPAPSMSVYCLGDPTATSRASAARPGTGR
jgi:hypothetical protein